MGGGQGRRWICSVMLAAFMLTSVLPSSYAQSVLSLSPPGQMVSLSPAFNPSVLKGIKVYPDNPLRFDFILDKGDDKFTDEQIKIDSTRLIKYFLASLTIPEKDLWVNLSPYEKDRIVPEAFGQTEMGRDLLAQDYLLKQITASVIYPEGDIGKKFWKKIYALAQDKYGTTDIPVDTFNKVWIVPEKAVVYENGKVGAAYVTESRLKVMLESDYLAEEMARRGSIHRAPCNGSDCLEGRITPGAMNGAPTSEVSPVSDLAKSVLREIVIPVLEQEVNEGKNFAQLRQVYSSLILAEWYKKKIKQSLLSAVYVDRKKTDGVNISDPKEAGKIWGQYVEAFKKGAYNFVKEERDIFTDEVLPRKYFSGGADCSQIGNILASFRAGIFPGRGTKDYVKVTVQLRTLDNNEVLGGNDFESLFPDLHDYDELHFRKGSLYKSGWNWAQEDPYGKEKYPTDIKSHHGLDIFEYYSSVRQLVQMPVGTPVGSLVNGTVIYTYFDRVVVESFDNTLIHYIHVHPLVKVGDRVVRGQRIAHLMDYDSLGFTPHLHLEVWRGVVEARKKMTLFLKRLTWKKRLLAVNRFIVSFRRYSRKIVGAAEITRKIANQETSFSLELKHSKALYRYYPHREDPLVSFPDLLSKSVIVPDETLLDVNKVDVKGTGGIDFDSNKLHLHTQNAGNEIFFHIDPAMLQQMQNATGFTPAIINIQSSPDIRRFLGLSDAPPATSVAPPLH